VWSQTWHEQQWILMVGKPLAWFWYEEKHLTHDWEQRVGNDSTYEK